MLKAEWKSLFQNKILLLVIIVIAAIPAIYAGLFLASMWDPYGNVDNLPVAVVNEDKSVDYNGTTLKVGEGLVDKLKENDSLAFNFVDANAASDGLKNGTYYMVITVPEDFSANAATLMDDQPKKMELQYATNPGTNYIASKLSETALGKIKASITEEVTKTYTETVFDQVATVGDGMQEAADGAGKIKDGLDSASDGNVTITKNLKKLADSTLTFADGADTLTTGLKEYTDGVSQVNDGAKQLDSGVSTLTAKLPTLTTGINTLNTGVQDYTDGVATLNANSKSLTDGTAKLASGASELSTGAGTLQSGATTYINGTKELASGAKAYVSGAEQLAAGASQLSALEGLGDVYSGITQLKTAVADGTPATDTTAEIPSLQKGVTQYVTGTNQLATGVKSYVDGVNQLKAGAGQLSSLEKLGDVSSGITKLKTAVADGTPATDTTAAVPALKTGTQQLEAGLKSLDEQIGSMASDRDAEGNLTLTGGIKSAIAGMDTASKGMTKASEGMTTASAGMTTASAGISQASGICSQVNQALSSMPSNISGALGTYGTVFNGALNDGTAKIDAANNQISAGNQNVGAAIAQLQQLQSAGTEISPEELNAVISTLSTAQGNLTGVDGLDAAGYSAQAQQISDGINNSVSTGVGQLTAATAGLNQIATALDDGAATMSAGAVTMSDGASSMSTGQQQMAGAVTQLSAGVGTLKAGVDQLYAGSQSVNAGVGQVSDGLTQLQTATTQFPQAAAGIKALNAGFDTLTANNLLLTGGASALLTSGSSLTSGVDQVAAGLTTLQSKTAQFPQAAAGIKALNAGFDTLTANDKKLTSGATQLIDNSAALSTGIGTAVSGAAQLASGASDLKDGVGTYTAGVTKLDSNSSKLTDGTQQLADGAVTLASGATQLADGTETLYSGTKKLVANNTKLNSGAAQLADGATQIQDGSSQLYDGSKTLGDGLTQLNDGSDTLQTSLADGATQVKDTKASDNTIDMFAAPVEDKETKITQVENNGHAMAPYMMSVGLWVGSLAFCLMYPLTKYRGKLKNGFGWWGSKASILYPVAILQGIMVIVLLHIFDGFTPVEMAKTIAFSILASMAFASIQYFFNISLGKVGSFLMLVFMVVQLAGSAGTYPVQLSPAFVAKIHKLVPFTYTVDAFRSTICGGESIMVPVLVMIGLIVVFSGLTIMEFEFRAKQIKEEKPLLMYFLEDKGLA